MTASGGHGNMIIRSAVSLPIALTRSKVQDIQMPEPAQTASVDSKRKHSLFGHYHSSPPLPSLLDVLGESVTALTNVRGMWSRAKSQKKQETWRTASISAKTQWTASGILMKKRMTTVCYSRIATPWLAATHAPLGKNIAPTDTMVCKDPIFCLVKELIVIHLLYRRGGGSHRGSHWGCYRGTWDEPATSLPATIQMLWYPCW